MVRGLELTLQALSILVYICNLPKGMPLNFFPCTLNSMACPKASLHLLAAACTPMAAVQVLTGCNLRWWSLSSAIERIYFLAHAVVRMVHVLARGHCNLHCVVVVAVVLYIYIHTHTCRVMSERWITGIT